MNLNQAQYSLKDYVSGLDFKVPIGNGQYVTAINLDNAATTPPLVSVLQEVINFAPTYSSIHRGTGYKSVVTSAIYEQAREHVLRFVGADPNKDTVIFLKNTTEAINKLSYRLFEENKKNVVLSTMMEHHSNDLPWRKFQVDYINIDEYGRLDLKDLERKLLKYRGRVKLVTVTGASNVTGYRNPIHKIAEITHRFRAKLLVDGAQLVPHAPVYMKPPGSGRNHIDYLVFSAHKMYAPFGTGVLIGPKATFSEGDPEYVGGGTVNLVTPDRVIWDEPPHKDEAGTPNIMGVIALTAAIKTISSIGLSVIDQHENTLANYAIERLIEIPGLQIYTESLPNEPRIGVIPFNIKGIHHEHVASILSNEAGIAVRSGCFCAQPYIQKLLKLSPSDMDYYLKNPHAKRPGMVRISFGLYNDFHEIDCLINTLQRIAKNKYRYLQSYAVR